MRIVESLVILMSVFSGAISDGYVGAFAGAQANGSAELPSSIATLEFSSLVPPTQGEMRWTSLVFVSETSIAAGLCSKGKTDNCLLSLIRWDGAALRPAAFTPGLDARAHLDPGGDGLCSPVVTPLRASLCCIPLTFLHRSALPSRYLRSLLPEAPSRQFPPLVALSRQLRVGN